GRVTRRRGRDHPHPVDLEAADLVGVGLQYTERPVQGFLVDPAGSVDTLSETHDLHAPYFVDESVVRDVGDQQPQRVRAAVDGRYTHGPSSHHEPMASIASSPKG